MDPSRLWLLKYVLGPSTLARLQQGAVGAEELDEIADKLLCTMIPSSEEQEGQTRQYLQVIWAEGVSGQLAQGEGWGHLEGAAGPCVVCGSGWWLGGWCGSGVAWLL